MVPLPQALALTLCERIIVEEGTRNLTLVSTFLSRRVVSFPSEPVVFSVIVPLVGGSGTGTIELAVVRLQTDETIYSQQGTISFPDRLLVVNAQFRVSKLRFPASGFYSFMTLIDGELIAQRRLRVYQGDHTP